MFFKNLCRTTLGFIFCLCFYSYLCAEEKSTANVSNFCFRHIETEAVIFDCMEIKNQIYCFDTKKDDYIPFNPDESWKRIEGNDCIKMDKSKRTEVPRGND